MYIYIYISLYVERVFKGKRALSYAFGSSLEWAVGLARLGWMWLRGCKGRIRLGTGGGRGNITNITNIVSHV